MQNILEIIFYTYIFQTLEIFIILNTRSHILYNCLKSTIYITHAHNSLKNLKSEWFCEIRTSDFYKWLANVILLTSLF